jgi:hypothetical protein
MAEVQYLASKLPDGLTWDEDRGLVAEGLVARQVADHLVLPRPGRRFATCTLDHLGGKHGPGNASGADRAGRHQVRPSTPGRDTRLHRDRERLQRVPAGRLGRFDHGRHARVECQQIAGMPSDYARTLYYDTVTHSHLVLRFLLDTMGASQVLLGTDYPADMSQANPVDWLEAAESVSDAERGAILRDNPQRILGARTTE